MAVRLTSMRKALAQSLDDVFDKEFSDWAVYYERDMDSRTYKIVNVERWINGEREHPAYRWHELLRVGDAPDELGAYVAAMRILEGLDK